MTIQKWMVYLHIMVLCVRANGWMGGWVFGCIQWTGAGCSETIWNGENICSCRKLFSFSFSQNCVPQAKSLVFHFILCTFFLFHFKWYCLKAVWKVYQLLLRRQQFIFLIYTSGTIQYVVNIYRLHLSINVLLR